MDMKDLRAAGASDHDAVVALVNRAYEKYVARIGRKPMPMTADYADLIARNVVHVLEQDGDLCGVLVLWREEDHMLLENIAVSPHMQGRGVGKYLMRVVETMTRAEGLSEILLYTNEKMVENIEIYKHLGYVETERRESSGFKRVFLKKHLDSPA